MGLAKCVSCKKYIDESEAVLVPVDDTHDAPYCVSCAPDTIDTFQEEDYDEDY